MRINNKTHWLTTDIRAMLTRGLDARGVGPAARKRLHVEIVYARRGGWCGGRALLGRRSDPARWMQIAIPRLAPAETLDDGQLRDLAATIEHEAAHLVGMRHGDMPDWLRYCRHDPEWRAGLVIQRQSTPKVDHVAKRAARALAMLAEHESKLARERRLVSKWRAKVRYYQRRGSLPKAEG